MSKMTQMPHPYATKPPAISPIAFAPETAQLSLASSTQKRYALDKKKTILIFNFSD